MLLLFAVKFPGEEIF